jgi:MarR family transcriptional regulator, transcriptional regulator for hemolysin
LLHPTNLNFIALTLSKIHMEEPLANFLISITKRYMHDLSGRLLHLSIDRYHSVLVLIDNHPDNLSQKALAEILQIDKSYMVTILDYLEGKGYVLRKKNPNDRREQLITLTAKARFDIPHIREAIKEQNRIALRNLTEKQLNIFHQTLGIIKENLADPYNAY